MITKIHQEKLLELIRSFYNLTGIKVAVYDQQFREMLAYPAHNTPFCTLMHDHPHTCAQCAQSTGELCRKCAREKRVIVEKCHAGLTEVIAPLVDGDEVMGYIMFGQITDQQDKKIHLQQVREKCKTYPLAWDMLCPAASQVLYYSAQQLDDASRILNALAGGIVYDRMIYSAEISLAQRIAEYIKGNLEKDLSVQELCRVFYLSKTEIYRITKPCMPDGIASFVKEERLKKAEQLLETTQKSNWQIAMETGFSDVEYFLRSFKAVKGISVAAYRKKL